MKITIALATFILSALPTFAADPVAITNPGFEEWRPFTPPTHPAEIKRTPQLNGQIPATWSAAQVSLDPQDAPLTVVITKDENTKHTGNASVRVENTTTNEVAELSHDFIKVQPSTKYTLKFWVKAENLVLNPKGISGIAVVANTGPVTDFSGKQTRRMGKPTGTTETTFDWQQFEYVFQTEAAAEQLNLRIQLRGASGKAWFDDVELVPSP